MSAASAAFALFVCSKLPFARLPYLVVGYASLATAVAFLFFAATGLVDKDLVAIGSVLGGIGLSLTMPFYFEAVSPFSPKRIAYACGIMSLAGMVASMLMGMLPLEAMLAAHLAALGASAFCLGLANRRAMPQPAQRANDSLGKAAPGRAKLPFRDFLNVFLVSGVCTFALSVVYGIIDTTAFQGSAAPAVSTAISQFGGIAAALAFLSYFKLRKNASTAMLLNVVFGVLATGILFLPFLSNDYAVSLDIFASAGWKLVMLLLFYLVVVTYANDRTRLLAGIALAYALPRLGLFVGINIAKLLEVGDMADFVRMTAIAFFSLYLILMVVWFVNAHERKKAEIHARVADEKLDRYAQEQEGARKVRCEELAREHGLTNREGDILYLLAQGRDIVFICDTLFLSRNTVKSYQKSIYAKLGVHSKQEIIDLVQT